MVLLQSSIQTWLDSASYGIIVQVIIDTNFFFLQFYFDLFYALCNFLDLLDQRVSIECVDLPSNRLCLLTELFDGLFKFADFLILFKDQNVVFSHDKLNAFLDLVRLFVVFVDLLQNGSESLNVVSIDIVQLFEEFLLFNGQVVSHCFKLLGNYVFLSDVSVVG